MSKKTRKILSRFHSWCQSLIPRKGMMILLAALAVVIVAGSIGAGIALSVTESDLGKSVKNDKKNTTKQGKPKNNENNVVLVENVIEKIKMNKKPLKNKIKTVSIRNVSIKSSSLLNLFVLESGKGDTCSNDNFQGQNYEQIRFKVIL